MQKDIQEKLESINTLNDAEVEHLLIDTYRLLDSYEDNDYNLCLSVICHIANTNPSDIMTQQLLHDCIIKSRIFLYDNLLSKNNNLYLPHISAQDELLKSFYTSNSTNTTLTKPQKEIFNLFQSNRRLIVSAPTSFGKTRIIREIIAHNNYKNIVLIMPTVSLLSEQYQDLKKTTIGYTLSKSSKIKINDDRKYILILTPERMNSFLEENPSFVVDFFVMDEIYKIDYKLNDDRFRVFSDILYRLAKTNSDFYLIGPYISDFSFKFREKYGVTIKRYDTEIVQKDFYMLDNIKNRGTHKIEKDNVRIVKDKFENLLRIVSQESIDGKFLIYRYRKQYVEDTAKKFNDKWPIKKHNEDLVAYLSETVSDDWDLISCIKRGVAFHHGAMPRHIQDLIVDEFNDNSSSGINYLFCTTSLTEGINSAAKNVVIYDKKIGNGNLLKTLDRKNIEGRAGRFMQHFIGRIFTLEGQDNDDAETVVEIEYFDKEVPALETLIQLDQEDMPIASKSDYKKYIDKLNELKIPSSIISGNKFVNIEGQLNLIHYLRNSSEFSKYFFDGQIPEKNCLENILCTIYNYLFSEHDMGKNYNNEVGKSILLGLTKYYVYYSPPFKVLLNSETVMKARTTDNARIRYVFDLTSKYFEFVWPKYLKAFERIYNFVAVERNKNSIDFAMLVAKLEYGTTSNHEIILRDSGIPNEIVNKISHYFSNCQNFEDVQKVNFDLASQIRKDLPSIEARIIDKYL